MSEREFELYLSLMRKLLRLGPEQTDAIADELRDHFDERFAALSRQGASREEAIRQALDEFGDAAGLATDFTHLARIRRRRLIMRCTLATVLVGAAALFAIQALTPPNPIIQGPPLAQAQAEGDAPAETLDVPEPEPPTSIDPTTFVPEPLAKKLTWEFTDLPLSEMLAELSRRIEMPILIDEVALADVGIPTDEPVSDRLRGLPAYLLLDRLAGPLHLDWYVDDGIAVVTTIEKTKTHLSMRSYVFTDLRDSGYEPESLLELIQKATTGPWQDIDGIGGSLSRVGDVIFVRQTDRGHREVAALLYALRHHGRETRVLNPPVHEAIREMLRVPISANFVDTPLSEVVSQLGNDTGIDIQLDEVALTDIGIPTDEPINFMMTDKPLRTVLKYMLEPLALAAVTDRGRLLITTFEVAENRTHVALHDVSDVCQSKEETDLLAQAVLNETEGPWVDIDGLGGRINVPVSGILVVRQTEKELREVRELLAAFRKAVDISRPLSAYAAEMEKIETRYYRMNAKTAADLQRVLPRFVKPGTWLGVGFGGDTTDEMVGEITTVAIDPKMEKLAGRAVSDQTSNQQVPDGEKPADAEKPDVLVIPQSVLIIKHTKAAHQEIDRFLNKVRESGSDAGRGMSTGGGWGGAGLGGAGGGGFFCVPDPNRLRSISDPAASVDKQQEAAPPHGARQ